MDTRSTPHIVTTVLLNDALFCIHRLRVQMARITMMRSNAPPEKIPGHEKPICIVTNALRSHLNTAAGLASVATFPRSVLQEANPLTTRSNPINPITTPTCAARFLRGNS